MSKGKKLILWGLLLISIALIGECRRQYYFHKEPPPGWKIVRDQDGYYGAQYPGSSYVIQRALSVEHMSRQQAINRAWQQVEFEDGERSRKWLAVTN